MSGRNDEARLAYLAAGVRAMSRTRPSGPRPDPDIAALRALRRATDDYLTVLGTVHDAMTDDAIAGRPDYAYLRAALAIGSGRRGAAPFATPVGLRTLLSRMLGEEEGTTST